MKISVITINFNNRNGLRRTMTSVLEQTATDFEYIVIDGGSTDDSRAIIEAQADRLAYWISEPDKGIYNAMNKGIQVARGEYCIFMNAGDSFYNHQILERTLPLLNGGDFYIGDVGFYDQKDFIRSPDSVNICRLMMSSLPHQASFIRTEILKERPYQEEYKIMADWEQMIFEMLVNRRSYEHLNYIVALYDTNGLSSQPTSKAIIKNEKEIAINKHFSAPIARLLLMEEYSTLERKMILAINKKSVWERDCKILCNVLKSIFLHLFGINKRP